MKRIYGLLVIFTLLLSCGENEKVRKDANNTSKAGELPNTVPGVETLAFTDTLLLSAGADMRFDKELFRVRAGKKIRIIFKNTGQKSPMSMAHNVVVLAEGTDIADFADLAHKAKAEDYVPSSVASLILAHTGLVAGGGSDEVAFTIPKPGVYDFICSFPGHWGTMQGKIVAE